MSFNIQRCYFDLLCSNGHIDDIKKYINEHIDQLNSTDNENLSFLMWAVYHNREDVVKYLVCDICDICDVCDVCDVCDINVNIKYKEVDALYHLITNIKFTNVNILRLLIKKGININNTYKFFESDNRALQYIVCYEKLDYFKEFLKAGANTNFKLYDFFHFSEYAHKEPYKRILIKSTYCKTLVPLFIKKYIPHDLLRMLFDFLA